MAIILKSRYLPDLTLNSDITIDQCGCSTGEKLFVWKGKFAGTVVTAINGEFKSHDEANGVLVIECEYPDGVFATNAENLKPIGEK